MSEALTTLVDAVRHSTDDLILQTLKAAGEETLIHKQGKIIDRYWDILLPLQIGNIH